MFCRSRRGGPFEGIASRILGQRPPWTTRRTSSIRKIAIATGYDQTKADVQEQVCPGQPTAADDRASISERRDESFPNMTLCCSSSRQGGSYFCCSNSR